MARRLLPLVAVKEEKDSQYRSDTVQIMYSDLRFRRKERLVKNTDFVHTLRKGSKYKAPFFLIYSIPNKGFSHRLGISVSKKVGKAHTRNRLKRMFREVFRHNKVALTRPTDIFIVLLPGADKASSDQLSKFYQKWLRKHTQKNA